MAVQENTKNWTAAQFKFIEWLSVPKKLRKPKTQDAFAKEIGVDPSTLWYWKRLPGFQDEVSRLCREMLKDNITDIYAALINKAIDGDVPAIKLAMEMTREYIPRQEVSGTDGGDLVIKVRYEDKSARD